MAEPRRPTSRHGLSPDSPLLGHGPQGAEGYDHQTGVLDLPAPPPPDQPVDLRELRELVPAAEPGSVALALVRREAEPGATVEVGSARGEVVGLPFPSWVGS